MPPFDFGALPLFPPTLQSRAEEGLSTPTHPLPLAERLQAAFAPHRVDDIQAHLGGDAERTARGMGAAAYATRGHIVLPANPSPALIGHEVAHVLQQRAGVRPEGGTGKPGDLHEQRADAAGQAVSRGGSAADALGPLPVSSGRAPSGVVQLKPLPEEDRGVHRGVIPPVDSALEGFTPPRAAPEPEPDWDEVHAVRPGDRLQQRRALLGGVNATEVWEQETDFQAQLTGASPTGEPLAVLRERFLEWCDSVLFRGGPGMVALLQLEREEDALRRAKPKPTPESLQVDVYRLRASRARAFEPTWAELKQRFLDQARTLPRAPEWAHLLEREPGGLRPGGPTHGVPPFDTETRLFVRQFEFDDSIMESIQLNDRAQQTQALVGATTAEEVFDLDPDFAARVRNVAVMYADIEGEKEKSAAAAEATRQVRESFKPAPGGVTTETSPEERELVDMAAEAAVERVEDETAARRFEELRGKFLKWGGRVIFERSVGGTALAKLAAEERALVKKSKQSSSLRYEVAMLRRRHAQAFEPKLASIKLRFLQGAAERLRFWFEKVPGVRDNERMTRPADTAEPGTKIKDLGGLITSDNVELEVADSVVAFARSLGTHSRARINISTYATHSWGRYSIDLFPAIPMDNARGLYDVDAMVAVFMAIDAAARDTGMKWHALYNDFEVARRVHEALGVRKIAFQWEHGPSPYVLHIHMDLYARVLDLP